MNIKARLRKIESTRPMSGGPALTLILTYSDEQERAAAQARFDSQPGPLKHICVLTQERGQHDT